MSAWPGPFVKKICSYGCPVRRLNSLRLTWLCGVGMLTLGIGSALVPGVLAQSNAAPQQQAPPAPTEPPAAAPPTAQAGATLFATSGCTQCHGPDGNGTAKAPNIREVRKRKTDEEIYLQIKEGKGAMPAFGDALTESEIHSVVAFLRAKDGWTMLPPAQPSK